MTISTKAKKFKKPAHENFEHGNMVLISNPLSKFPCQPNLRTPDSLSLPRIPTLASLTPFVSARPVMRYHSFSALLIIIIGKFSSPKKNNFPKYCNE